MTIEFDLEQRRLEHLQRLQDSSLGALRLLGAAPMTSGVTRAIPSPATGADVVASLAMEVARGASIEGPRFLDRHSTDSSSTYRNTRFAYFVSNYGSRPYAYDPKTGRRVSDGAQVSGDTYVGVNFNMDAPDARKTWDAVLGNGASFDDVKAGTAPLSTPQIQALFDASMRNTESLVDASAGDAILSENQRLSLLSVAYDTPDLMSTITPFLRTGDTQHVALSLLDDGVSRGPQGMAKRYMQASKFVGQSGADRTLPDFADYRTGKFQSPELRDAIKQTASKLGVDPVDVATAISYETGGTFNPWQRGPVTQYGQHRGLIQWGEPQRREYGVTPEMSVTDQMNAVGKYLQDAGVKPGMGLLDIYSAINAGRVGRYNASDANNGGAPGTVRDKVETQMALHRKRSEVFING